MILLSCIEKGELAGAPPEEEGSARPKPVSGEPDDNPATIGTGGVGGAGEIGSDTGEEEPRQEEPLPVVCGNGSNASVSTSTSFPWGASDVSVVSRTAESLDLLTVESGEVFHRRLAEGKWTDAQSLGRPSAGGVSYDVTSIAAVHNGGRIDLGAIAASGKFYHRYTDRSPYSITFHGDANHGGWDDVQDLIPTLPNAHPESTVAGTSWQDGDLHFFYWTPSENLAHLGASAFRWQATPSSGDSPSKEYLRPPRSGFWDLTAVSDGLSTFRVFSVSQSDILHVGYSGAWSQDVLHAVHDTTGAPLELTSISSVSLGHDNIEFFASGPKGMSHAWKRMGEWSRFKPSDEEVSFLPVSAPPLPEASGATVSWGECEVEVFTTAAEGQSNRRLQISRF